MIKITIRNWKKEYFTILIFTTLQIFTKYFIRSLRVMPSNNSVKFGQVITHTNYDHSIKAVRKTVRSTIPPTPK